MAKAVRMADIAEKLGISIVSVSKALAGKDGVSEEMRAKILATAKELGYQTPAAKAKTADESYSIGVLVADRFFNENTFYSNMPNFLVNRKVDGLIFMGEIDRRYMSTAAQSGLPFLLLDFYDDTIAADCVLSDNVSGEYQLTKHLIKSGRRNIAFVGSVWATSSIMDRYLGYCKALLRAGIEPRADWRIDDRDKEGMFIPLELPKEMPEAFVCSCDEVAFNLVEKLHREGYKVPQDVAVAGYDDFRFSTICRPPLSSYRVDVDAMAAAAVAQIRRKMAHRAPYAPTVMVPGALVLRESTGE